MGCLKNVINIIILIAVAFGFFYFEGPKFLKEKYTEYTSPPREVLIEQEKNFGNLGFIPNEYKLKRSLGIGKIKKITATYTPSGQKINVFDLGDSTTINQSDFYSKQIDLKLYQILDKLKNIPFGLEEIEVTQRGTILAKGKIIPYVNFKAQIKYLPFVKISGTFATYNTTNTDNSLISKIEKTLGDTRNKKTTKAILSSRLTKKYSYDTTKNFIMFLDFTAN